jgi:acetyltransferase-like isoleucine patch superfamily enzyme
MFRRVGRGVVFGRNVTVRHGRKIEIGDNVIVDDNAVLDAKGDGNRGITIGEGVYIGRNTIVYCKNGDIEIGRAANISANCQVFSSNRLVLGAGTVVGAFTYLLSGGEYDASARAAPFAEQSGTITRGPLEIGPNCWIAAGVCVLDAASIGERCVIGAGAVVTKPIPPHSVAVGVPARVVTSRGL